MKLDTIRALAISKLPWIRRQQRAFRGQDREAPRDYITGESHYVWGRRYLLTVEERDAAPRVEIDHRRLFLRIRPQPDVRRRAALVDEWYRQQIRDVLPEMLAGLEPAIGCAPRRIFICRMRTKWGSCNASTRNIRLNTELAKKPVDCLEYVLVHELVHLREATHGAPFRDLMDKVLPGWSNRRRELNQLPLRHETWTF